MISAVLTWVSAARWRKSLSHCVEAVLPFTLAAVPAWNPWVGSVAVVAWFYSREVCQCQMRAKQPGASTVTVWDVGYLPWKWDLWSGMDVLFPAVAAVSVSVVIKLI